MLNDPNASSDYDEKIEELNRRITRLHSIIKNLLTRLTDILNCEDKKCSLCSNCIKNADVSYTDDGYRRNVDKFTLDNQEQNFRRLIKKNNAI